MKGITIIELTRRVTELLVLSYQDDNMVYSKLGGQLKINVFHKLSSLSVDGSQTGKANA